MISVGLHKQVMKPYKQGTALFMGLTFEKHGAQFPLFLGHFSESLLMLVLLW